MKPIFLQPIFHEKLWGGSLLGEQFGYPIPSGHTGECWAISAHPNGDCRVLNPEYAGATLSSLWREHPELFGRSSGDGEFPLLIKIIDAREDLSIQVLPDDAYYTVYHVEQNGLWERDWGQPFVNMSVINGRGSLDGREIGKGDHFLLPSGYGPMRLEGELELICSHP